MVAYSFRPRFAEPILAGTKRQTIRADRKRHARPGEQLQLYTGMRTLQCRLIGLATCTGVEPITLLLRKQSVRVLYREGAGLRHFFNDEGRADHDIFARRDGFKDWDDLQDFWMAEHPGIDEFEGVLISWGDLQ